MATTARPAARTTAGASTGPSRATTMASGAAAGATGTTLCMGRKGCRSQKQPHKKRH
ncbi:hypothetical protein AA0483_0293 [Acetobacter syzygii NRIC 0483]|nr:hypothetical protein AA0483_0293 [Acetobacter syzygii NRIC 0483]